MKNPAAALTRFANSVVTAFQPPFPMPPKPMKAIDRMAASTSVIAVPLARSGTSDRPYSFPHQRQQHQRRAIAAAGRDREHRALHEVVVPRGLEHRHRQDRAVGGDQRQVDAEFAEQRGARLLDEHFGKLHGGRDDHDVHDDPQILGVEADQQQIDRVGKHAADRDHEHHRNAHAPGRGELRRTARGTNTSRETRTARSC